MNYYEELGLPRSATTDQIHSAYRALVNILHPDKQQDDVARRLSECQLRRLNQIASILRDPLSRKSYDASLIPKRAPKAAVEKIIVSETLTTRIIWMLCLAIGFGGIFSYLREDINHTRTIQPVLENVPCETPALEGRIRQLEQEVRKLRARTRVRLERDP